jgi:hypothetical protein
MRRNTMAPKSTFTTVLHHWITKTAATIAALSLIGTTLWAATDFTGIRPALKYELQKIQMVLDQNNLAILQIRLQLLMEKQKFGTLTFEEQQELCAIARTLGYVGIPGC